MSLNEHCITSSEKECKMHQIPWPKDEFLFIVCKVKLHGLNF